MLRCGAFRVKDPQTGLLPGFLSVQMEGTTIEPVTLGSGHGRLSPSVVRVQEAA